ncbi:MORN repeat-containing protein [Aquimarina pacifica]|uniref:MORN repeat-containing protein n=1 Tax=Aquimarina pacifica TaxID=1296415 RepID=UPI00046FA95B|nr:hypothetical protein [Aquimarina pacifica]
MKIKKTNVVLYGLLLTVLVVGIGSKFREQKLKKQLRETQAKEALVSSNLASQNELLQIDSLLLKGRYKTALQEYKQQLKTIVDDDNTYIKLRIELAKQFIQLSKGIHPDDSISIEQKVADTSTVKIATTKGEVRKYDSLHFALEKVKAQLNRVKKQQQKKSYGEYLTFTNRKRHKVHYVGQVRNDKANGYGIAFFDTGSRYEGEWKENLRHGDGSFYWTDGEYYVGQYQNDRRTGQGTYFWPNGEKYTGQWKDDQRNGEGTFYGKDKNIMTQGVWKNDKLIEQSKKN